MDLFLKFLVNVFDFSGNFWCSFFVECLFVFLAKVDSFCFEECVRGQSGEENMICDFIGKYSIYCDDNISEFCSSEKEDGRFFRVAHCFFKSGEFFFHESPCADGSTTVKPVSEHCARCAAANASLT